MIERFLKEPLVHFILAGAVLFTAFRLIQGPAPPDAMTIRVDRETLLTYLQFRANAFDDATFSAVLDSMAPAELEQLLDAYIEEEVLYREAAALGLDTSDYVIRQRMIQKMRFLIGDVSEAATESLPEGVLQAYLEANREAYVVEPSVTFTHVFFDMERRGTETARADAESTRDALTAAGAGFNDAPGSGDRFPYLRNYVERTLDYVASHFGQDFAGALAALSASDSVWQGPIRSAYGEHVVLLSRRTERRHATLEEVREAVERDYLREQSEQTIDRLTQRMREQYRIDVVGLETGDSD